MWACSSDITSSGRTLQKHDRCDVSQVDTLTRRSGQVLRLFVGRQDSHRLRVLLTRDLYLSILSLNEGITFCPALLARVSKKLTKQEQLLPESIVVDIIFTSPRLKILELRWANPRERTSHLLEVKLK
jgi:hypothetical protein